LYRDSTKALAHRDGKYCAILACHRDNFAAHKRDKNPDGIASNANSLNCRAVMLKCQRPICTFDFMIHILPPSRQKKSNSTFLTTITQVAFLPIFLKLCLIISILLFICNDSYGQRKLTKTYYKNGQLESKGILYTYSIYYDAKMPPKMQKFGDIEKKDKEWKYWYQNGQLSRIENYKLIKDKNSNDLPDGKWTYFNEQGIKYREDSFRDGILYNTTKEIYKDSQLSGKISIQNGIPDTTLLIPFTSGQNLILNSGFDYFYYKPVQVVYNGQTQIEEWIPFWVTPGRFTPDYISNLRFIDKLNYNYLLDTPLPDKYNYVGIALYKESENYSEYIQGRLKEPLIRDHKYCLKTSIALSSYSRFSVNRLAFNFSTTSISITSKNEITFSTPVIFTELPTDNKQFTFLCDFFVATGGEQYITVGRFSTPDKLEVTRRENIPQSQFGLDKSAYYLIDYIELFEIHDTAECYCKVNKINGDANKIKPVKDDVIIETNLNKLKQGSSVILENVNFEFNSYKLLPTTKSVLKTLLKYLNDNPEVRLRIAGHTDDIGTEEYNLDLSINRAKTVYKWLLDNGINDDRLEYIGFGKSLPLYKETEEKYRALNRRVEVKIIDK
jgi:OmpA-OmpF porin, OOP family